MIKKSEKAPLRASAWLRFFLWWGSEVVQQTVLHRKLKPRIHWLSFSEKIYPLSVWVFQKENNYCLISGINRTEILIYEMPKMGSN